MSMCSRKPIQNEAQSCFIYNLSVAESLPKVDYLFIRPSVHFGSTWVTELQSTYIYTDVYSIKNGVK